MVVQKVVFYYQLRTPIYDFRNDDMKNKKTKRVNGEWRKKEGL
jgi:hypothetical protein